jgi:hypothetical protein
VDRVLIVIGLVALVGAVLVVGRLRGRRANALPTKVDAAGLGLDAAHGDTAVVAFSGPLCHACQEWGSELEGAGIPYRKVDVLKEAGLARAHGVTTTPVVLVVERSSGTVLEGFDDGPDAAKVDRVRELVLA